jgi:purine-cytosine permease-like protein
MVVGTSDQLSNTGAAHDDFGQIESVGIEYIPEEDRHSSPGKVFTVFTGGNMCFSVIMFGWIPITFGLNWFEAMSASFTGLLIGSALVAPIALFGPRIGSNNQVASGAHFGVRGRLINSTLGLLFAFFYIAIAVWVSGDALVYGLHRLIGTPANTIALIIGYVIISAEFFMLALYGHDTVVGVHKAVVPTVIVLLLIGIIAYGGQFNPYTHYSDYLLGSFWPTWFLAVSVALGGPLSYASSFGDFTRRVSRKRYSDISIAFAAGAGVFVGLGLTTLFGGFTAAAFASTSGSYVHDLINNAPLWYVVPILLIGLAEGIGHGSLDMYGAGLDLESIFPKINRPQATLFTSLTSLILLLVGVFVLNALNSIIAMTIILNSLAGAMLGIMLTGFFIARRGHYDPYDLQVFNEGRTGGRYWFTAGWNLRAIIPFVIASFVGVLMVHTTLYSGPMANIAKGMDVSFITSILLGALGYTVALRYWPEELKR